MKGRKVGVILGYFAMVISNLASFFLTPLMISVFGVGEYGVYKLVISITSYFALADLGLSNSIVRFISEYRATNDKKSESKFITLIMIIDIVLGFILTFMGLLVHRYIPVMFESSFKDFEISLLQTLFIILVINGIFNLFNNLTTGIIKSYEDFGYLKFVDILKLLFRTVVILILLLSGHTVVTVVIFDTLINVLRFILTWCYCRRKYFIKINLKNIKFKFAKNILSYSAIVFIDALGYQLFWSADGLIIGVLISSKAIAIYSIGSLISSLFLSLSGIVSDVLMPGVVAKVARNDSNHELTTEMIKIGRIKLSIISLPIIGFIFLGKQFIALWVGVEYIEAYIIALLVVIPSMISGLFDVGINVMWAKNKHKMKSIVSLTVALLNIIVTIILVKKLGIIGAAIGTSFAFTVGYVIFNSIYFHKFLMLDMYRFFTSVIKGTWVTILSTSIFALIITNGLVYEWPEFLFQMILITIFYVIVLWLVSLNNYEKDLVKSIFQFNKKK